MPICYLLCVFFILLRCAVCVVEVVRQVEVGELWCDSLRDAQDSLLLRIAVSSTEVRVKSRRWPSRIVHPEVQMYPSSACTRTQENRHVGGNVPAFPNTTDLSSFVCISVSYRG